MTEVLVKDVLDYKLCGSTFKKTWKKKIYCFDYRHISEDGWLYNSFLRAYKAAPRF